MVSGCGCRICMGAGAAGGPGAWPWTLLMILSWLEAPKPDRLTNGAAPGFSSESSKGCSIKEGPSCMSNRVVAAGGGAEPPEAPGLWNRKDGKKGAREGDMGDMGDMEGGWLKLLYKPFEACKCPGCGWDAGCGCTCNC